MLPAAAIFTCRGLTRSAVRFERFSREHLRNRLYKQNIKDLSKELTKQESSNVPYASDIIPVRPSRHLWRALGFTCAVGVGTFTVAICTDFEKQRQAALNAFNPAAFIKSQYTKITTQFTDSGQTSTMQQFQQRELTSGDKCAIALVLMNLGVFLMWKIKTPAMQQFMWRYFTNSYASRSLTAPMLLSTFSHSSFVHFALNMYVVYTFTNVTIDKFMGADKFWAFYLTAGVVSSLASLLHKSAVRSSVRALGASGAIMGILGYTCCLLGPEARLKIVFIPNFDFSATSAIIGVVLFDLVGLVFRFRLFDHAAHLGGSLFGIFYALLGDRLIWEQYGDLVEAAYRKLRGYQ